MHKIIRFFFYHHLIIALSALALCMQTFLFLQVDFSQLLLLLFVFSATLLSYNVHFFLAAEKSQSSQQLQWFASTRTFTLVFNILILLVTLWCWWQMKEICVYILISILINATYTAPLILKKPFQLPGFLTFIKSYFIGFVWAYVTVVLPVAYAQLPFGINEYSLFINRLLLVAIATLIFDYRDKLHDYEFGVHTPANKMNEQQFSLFFSANIAVYFLSVLQLVYLFSDYKHLWQLINGMLLLYLFRQSKKQQNDFFYLGWVDAVLILSFLLSLFLLF